MTTDDTLLIAAASLSAPVMTPLGLVPKAGMTALHTFGHEADRLEYPRIDIGGFIVPGLGPAAFHQPGQEHGDDGEIERARPRERPAREEVGPAAGTRQGRTSSQAAAPGAPPHTFQRRLTHLNLDLPGLAAYHPRARVTASTEEAVYLDIPVGLFRDVPIRARLTLEVPLASRGQLSRPFVESRIGQPPFEFRLEGRLPTSVPDIRVWARWEGGALDGHLVASHHQNPDGCICACMPHEWIRGVHPLEDYVAFCIIWIGKALHERLFGRYPGCQHYGPWDRARRDRVDEYCGCGSTRTYRACCRAGDHDRSSIDLWHEAMAARQQYFSELTWQGRASRLPDDASSLAVAS